MDAQRLTIDPEVTNQNDSISSSGIPDESLVKKNFDILSKIELQSGSDYGPEMIKQIAQTIPKLNQMHEGPITSSVSGVVSSFISTMPHQRIGDSFKINSGSISPKVPKTSMDSEKPPHKTKTSKARKKTSATSQAPDNLVICKPAKKEMRTRKSSSECLTTSTIAQKRKSDKMSSDSNDAGKALVQSYIKSSTDDTFNNSMKKNIELTAEIDKRAEKLKPLVDAENAELEDLLAQDDRSFLQARKKHMDNRLF